VCRSASFDNFGPESQQILRNLTLLCMMSVTWGILLVMHKNPLYQRFYYHGCKKLWSAVLTSVAFELASFFFFLYPLGSRWEIPHMLVESNVLIPCTKYPYFTNEMYISWINLQSSSHVASINLVFEFQKTKWFLLLITNGFPCEEWRKSLFFFFFLSFGIKIKFH